MKATSPDGEVERTFRIEAFALFGGRPSDERFSRTGRVDVHVTEEGGNDEGGNDERPVSLRWEVRGPLDE